VQFLSQVGHCTGIDGVVLFGGGFCHVVLGGAVVCGGGVVIGGGGVW
jgi:hypothetical protein